MREASLTATTSGAPHVFPTGERSFYQLAVVLELLIEAQGKRTMVEQRVARRLAAILAADVAGYSRLTGADEEGTLAQLRALRKDLVDPTILVHHGHTVKTTGDGMLVEFASVVDAVRCAVELQRQMIERNAGTPADKQINFRIGINLGDVVVESDGDLMGEGVNVAARLENIAPPGGICLSRAAHDQVKGKITVTMHDRGQQRLKNIAEPVQIFMIDSAGAPLPLRVRSITMAAATILGFVAIAAGGAWYLRAGISANSVAPQSQQAAVSARTAPHMSIVVLPFANLSGDPGQDYFADGLTEDLTTDLSRIDGVSVIARNTAFTFKGKAVSAVTVGHELSVRYVLEGSVRRSGNEVRVNAQLIDAERGAHQWADRFDVELSDLFKLQNAITGRIARALSLELVDAENARAERERPHNPGAIDLLMQARAISQRAGQSGDKIVAARDLFRRALDRDDKLAAAWSGLALTYLQNSRFSTTREDDLREATQAVSRALALDPKNATVFHAKAILNYELGNIKGAIEDEEAATALDRNCTACWGLIAASKILLGEPSQAFPYLDRALELSPRDPVAPLWYLFKGVAYLHLKDDNKAIEWLEKSKQLDARAGFTRFFLASALALAGRDADAQSEMREFLGLNPGFTLARFKAREPSRDAMFLAQRQRIYEGARKAGLPEQ
jgi:adenylate cyclase